MNLQRVHNPLQFVLGTLTYMTSRPHRNGTAKLRWRSQQFQRHVYLQDTTFRLSCERLRENGQRKDIQRGTVFRTVSQRELFRLLPKIFPCLCETFENCHHLESQWANGLYVAIFDFSYENDFYGKQLLYSAFYLFEMNYQGSTHNCNTVKIIKANPTNDRLIFVLTYDFCFKYIKHVLFHLKI